MSEEVQKIADMFRVDGDTLRHITDHFVKEMERGSYIALTTHCSKGSDIFSA